MALKKYVVDTPIPVSYSLAKAEILQVIFNYDLLELHIRWAKEESDNTRRDSKITILSGTDITQFNTLVLTRITAGDPPHEAVQYAAYQAIAVKESFPSGSIL